MNPATDLCFGKGPLTSSHGDSLEDHSFQSLKSKEVRDSQSPSREIKFRNSGGVAGGVLVPDTTGWNVQTSTEVSPDGRAFRSETLAKTDGVEQVAGGRAEFAGRNEQKSSASHHGDDQNYVKKAAESSKTHLQEKIVIGDENSGRTEMKSSSVTSSSSKVVSSSSTKVLSSGDPGFDLEPLGGLTQDQRYQQSIANTSALRSEQQKYQTSSNVRDTYEENKKYVDMDKASPEYQQHVQYLMAQPGTVVSNTVEYPKPGVKLITTVKQLPDGTTVKTKRYETEASADAGSISQTMKQQQRVTSSSTSSQKTSSEKRTQDTEDVFSRLTRPRDSSVPSGSRSVPETPLPEDIYSRLQKSRGGSVNEKKFSETIDERATQILRDTNQQPSSTVPRNAPTGRVPDLVDNVEVFSTKTVKKDLSQATRNEKITSADFIATERDRHVLDRESPIKRGPDGLPSALAPITPGGYGRPQPDEVVPTNGYTSTGVVQQTSKSSSKFSESRRFSTETVESYQHSESHNENQDFTTHGFPSVRRPIDEPKGRSPSAGRPSQGFSTHGFPSVRSDKPTQEYPSDRPRPQGDYTTPERQHPVKPADENVSSTTRANYSTNETRRHVTLTTNDFSTHGFPSVRPDTPTRDSTKRPTGFEPAGAAPRRPSSQDQPLSPGRKPSTDGYSSTHGFPSVKTPSPGDFDTSRRPSGVEPAGLSPRRPSAQDQPQSPGRKPSTDGYSSTHGFPSAKTPTSSDFDAPRRPSGAVPATQGRRPAPEDFSTHGFPSVKPGRTTPTQSAPQYEDTSRTTPVRRLPSVDREDTVSVTSDRSNSVTYEKRIDAAHQAFARSLRCSSPVDTIRRDSFSDRQTPRSSVTIVRHTYVPSRRDGRSPSHESITNSDSSRISSGTVTKTYRSPAPDNRRPSGPKSPLNKAAPSHVSNETIDLTLTRKITARPADKPTPKQPAGTITPTTPRRPNTHATEEEVNRLLDTATKHTTPKRTPTSPDTKPTKPKTSPTEGLVSLEITEKHNQTTNKPVSSPHIIPTAPKADRSPSDRPTKNLPSSAPTSITTTTTTTTSTTIPHYMAPKSSVTDKPKPSSTPSKPDTETVTENSTTRLTKTVKADARDTTTTRRQPERGPGPQAEPLSEPEDTDEGYVPERKGRSKPRSQRPTSDDEGFEPDSPRAGSPTSDFEFHRSRPTELVDEEDAILRRTRKTDRKTVTNEFLDTERGAKQPKDGDRKPRYPGDDQPGAKKPRQPEDLTRQSPLVNEPGKPTKRDEPKRPQFLPNDKSRTPGPLNGEPDEPSQEKPRRPDEEVSGPRSPTSKPRRPDEETVEPVTRRPSEQTQEPTDRQPGSKKPRDGKPPLDRSETFDERCRQILGMETETKTEKTKRLQEFIDTERETVYVQQTKAPFDTVSIEDCDDDDEGAPKKRPTQSTTTVTRTTKTTNGEYPRDRSPTEKRPQDGTPGSPKGTRPTKPTRATGPKETVVTQTTTTRKTTGITKNVDGTTRPKGYPRSDVSDEVFEPSRRRPESDKPRERGPTDETTVRKITTITSETDERSPLSRPKDYPRGRSPTEKDYPRGKSPTEKPRGRSPVDDTTVKRTTKVTEDTTITSETDERSPLSRPKDYPRGRSPTEKDYPRGKSPTEKPRGRSPVDDTTVKRTTKVTEDTTFVTEVDQRSPLSRPKDYPRGRSPTEKDYPRGKSPTEKPRGRSPVDDTTVKRTTKVTEDTTFISEVDQRSPTSRRKEPKQPQRPNDRSPSPVSKEKDRPRGRSPADKQPKEKPFGPGTSDDESPFEETVVECTTTTARGRTISEEITDRTSKVRPREVSPSDKPVARAKSPSEKPKGPKTTKDSPRGTSPTQKKPQPRDQSPTEKPKSSRPTSDTNVQKMVKTITERTVVGERSPKDRPRGVSPSEKPKIRQPVDEVEEVVTETYTRRVDTDRPCSPLSDGVSPDEELVRSTVEETDVDKRRPKTQPREESPSSPRDRSPSEKPKGVVPTDDTTVKRVVKSTVTEERVSKGPRGPSPTGKPGPKTFPRDKSPKEKPTGPKPTSGTTVQRIIKTITERTALNERSPKDRPLGTSPLDKPKRRPLTEEPTSVQRTSKTVKGTTVLRQTNVDTRSPKGRPGQRAPATKPKEAQPSDDESEEEVTVIETWYSTDGITPQTAPSDVPTDDETLVQRTSRTTKGRTTVEQVEVHGKRPQGKSPTSPRDRSPLEKPKGTKPTDSRPSREPTNETTSITVVQKTAKVTKVRPNDEEEYPSDEDIDEKYVRQTKTSRDSTTVEDRPRGRSPSSRQLPRGSSPSPVDETTVRSTTTKTIRQDTDFEKRYPNGRPREPSPTGKASPRRPSKPTTTSSTTTTTTTRNRSTLEEQDLTKSPRTKPQPSTRDKLPTKSTPSYVPYSQPTTEKRVPADLPTRKPKSTFGATTRTTTQTTVTRLPATRPVPAKETPRKPSTGSRPTARQPERKQPESISPDSSPSRPASEVAPESPNRSPNASPSRHSPSPTRSVKLEDITSSVVTTKKTTVVVDKTKPKVTHVTTAKFQVSPPTSPTKVMPAPELKSSPGRKPTPKPTVTKLTTNKTTTKVTTSRKDVVHPTDSERDSEVPTDAEDIDSPLGQKSPSKKMPVTLRKESAPVHRVTKVDKDVQKMSRSTSENLIKTTTAKRPSKQEPLEPIASGKTSPKSERRPNKHLSTKTINLTTFDKVINSEDMENVVIDIQQAKSSREPSPNKIVPTPVSVDLYTGKPRYPDVVQEPEDEPRKKPNVKNIPIFEEETNEFVGCQITEVHEDYLENTTKGRTRKFIDGESRPQRPTPTIVTSDNVDNECLLSVHDKVSKFISTAEEVSKPKTSAPFRRDVPEEDAPEDDECLLSVDEKVSKFLKTAESVTKEVMTSTPKPIERPRIDDLDEDLRRDECVLSVSEKVNRFTTKAEKLAPSVPQRSPELVARIERQISKQSDMETESPRPDSPEDDDSPTLARKVKQTKSLFEREERKYTDRQIDILSRPSVWDKKPKSDVKLDDIIGEGPEDPEPRTDGYVPRKSPEQPDAVLSKPVKPVKDTVSKTKEIFETKTSTPATRPGTKSPEWTPRAPTDSPRGRRPSDESDSWCPGPEPDDTTEETYGTSKARRVHETSSVHTTTVRQSPERRSPARKASQPEIRPSAQTPTRTSKRPGDYSPSRRYSDDPSPRPRSRDQPSADLYTETRQTSEYTTRSSTQKHPEDRSPDRTSPTSPRRQRPAEEPEDYTFSSLREETNQHHTSRTTYRSPKDSPLNQTSLPDDDDQDHSPARSTSTVSSQRRVTNLRNTSSRVTDDSATRRPRRPSGNEPSTPTSTGRGPKPRGVPETIAARRNIFEKSPGDVSPRPGHRRPSYMDHTKSSMEHSRRDSLEVSKTTYSRKSSMEDEPYDPSPRGTVKFGVVPKSRDESKPKRQLSASEIPIIEDVFDLEFLEEILNIVTSYEQRRRVRAQIRIVKKLLETKSKEEVSKMTKITTIRKTSTTSQRDSPIPRRDTPMRPDRYHASDDIDSESVIESHHIEEHEEIIRERSISPQTKTSKTITKVTEVRKVGEPATAKRAVPKKEEPKDSKPIWATKNILKKPSENEKVARALSAKKTTSTTSTSRTQQTHRQRVAADEDCITSSYGIGPTDEDGRPLFGIRALKKKTTKTAQPSETTKVTGTVITEKFYSENGAEPVGERKVTVYSTNPEDLQALESQYDRRDSETVKRESLSKDGLTSVTKVQKIGNYKPGDVPALTDDAEFTKTSSKMVRRGSVKEMSEKFIRKESSSSVTEKSNTYPKAGLILRTRTNSGATADTADQYEVRGKSAEYDDESDVDECDVEIRTSRKHSKVVTESEDEMEIRRKLNTRSFLNSGGAKVTGVDDVLDRMRNADNVVVDGDTMEDREARSLLNKFLGASVLMSGMESIIPQKELKKGQAASDNLKKQEVKTTRVTKTIKTASTGGNSSSPVARETCDFEEIWDEETLKTLLEKSTSYEERRAIRARLRQLMAEREGLSTTTTEKTETKQADGAVVTTTTKVTTRTVTGTPKPVSPFAKFQQLDKQSSLQSPKSPLTPTTPGGSSTGSTPIFRFTDPALNARAATVKEQLLQWCQSKTQEYENVQITNFSQSWTDGLAFCALIHHFLPDAFDYSKLTPKQRRYNFDLAFRVADEKAGIAPLLDVEDMVVMKRPDWKCVFTYVQSIYRRFRNCQ